MKKIILLTAILFVGLAAANAQETTKTGATSESGTTATTILKVHLHNLDRKSVV